MDIQFNTKTYTTFTSNIALKKGLKKSNLKGLKALKKKAAKAAKKNSKKPAEDTKTIDK